MNIFYLDNDTKKCATMHLDKHCVKMILEYAQLLSTAHRVLDGDEYADASNLYKATHKNHPSAVWVRQSLSNYQWLYNLFVDLCYEYKFRYNKDHKTSLLMSHLQYPPKNINKNGDFTEPTPAMPDDCKIENDSIASYRKYYQLYKSHIANWKMRNVPSWYVIQ